MLSVRVYLNYEAASKLTKMVGIWLQLNQNVVDLAPAKPKWRGWP
jgi:hypothetical protein